MGTCTSLDYATFRIEKSNISKAFSAVRAYIEQDLAQSKRLAWRAPSCPFPDEAEKATTLAEQFRAWSWRLRLDGEGNVSGIDFTGEKEHELDGLFAAVGPFVEAGSCVEMRNENGARSLWRFDGSGCHAS